MPPSRNSGSVLGAFVISPMTTFSKLQRLQICAEHTTHGVRAKLVDPGFFQKLRDQDYMRYAVI